MALLLSSCGPSRPEHRFTDVVDTKASPDGGLVAALVWEERGIGKPHTSGIVIVARGGEPRDGEPVLLATEDFRNHEYRWTAANALEIRLPCGWWSSLTNHWQPPDTNEPGAKPAKRSVDIAFLPPRGCLVATGTSALPPGASQPAALMLSPN